MTLDGVIQTEESDGDGSKHGGWFFPYSDEVTGAAVQERLGQAGRSAIGSEDLRRLGNVLADPFELLAECGDRDKVRRLEYPRLERLAAYCIFEREPRGKREAVETNGWA
jgi:hypothetical protein